MEFTVLVDNMVSHSLPGLLGQWGYAALIEHPGGTVQLDTGASDLWLRNMNIVKPHAVPQHLVLSHGHNDHIGGVKLWRETFPQGHIWASCDVARERYSDSKGQIHHLGGGATLNQIPFTPIDDVVEILPQLWAFTVPQMDRDRRFSTGKGLLARQNDGTIGNDAFHDDLSLAVKGEHGWSLLLGCAHAALPNIMAHASSLFDVTHWHTVVGGTHMIGLSDDETDQWIEALRQWSVAQWRVNHCTGFSAAARLAASFSNVSWAGVGSHIEL